MGISIGINGFGRIGRYLLRLWAEETEHPIVAINARSDNAQLAHLFKYDSVHGRFAGSVSHDDDGLIINDRHIRVTRYPIGEWKWKELGVDLVIETSGAVRKREGLLQHIHCGATKAIMAAPAAKADITIVMGVNHDKYDAELHHLISAASCTTNCLAPVASVLHTQFGIEYGLMTTIHAYTMSQRLLDGSQKDWRRARAAGVSMIPTSTGAAKATGLVIPALKGRLDGIAIRVPIANVSTVDLTCSMNKDVNSEMVNAAMKEAAEGCMRTHMGYSEEPLVSIDYVGDTHGGVVDALSTSTIGKRMLKMLIWYDNEAGFTNQLKRLTLMVANSM